MPYSTGVSSNKISTNFIESKKWMKSYALEKWESTLNLCVHAHGPDVELIMEVSCDNNNPLIISSSGIYVWSFATVVLTMIVPLWFHFSDKLKHLSSADQCISATSILIILPVLPSGTSRISKNCVASYESSSSIASHRFQISPGIWVINHSRTPISESVESIPHSDSITLSNFHCLRV